jgi:arginine N-succinyltransferase
MTHAPVYRVRAMRKSDLAGFRALRDLAGAGFTSLALDDDALAQRLAHSAESFAAEVQAPGRERYLLALEHIESAQVVGVAGVKACVGDTPPFFNFRVLQIAQASAAAQRRFDLEVLILVNEFTRCSEVGSLFVRKEHRAGGAGRLLAQARYMLIASARERFADTVVAELRGVVDAEGRSPFWEHLGRHFFRMSFQEADRLSAATDNQFILDLMPKYPIYVDLLPEAARAVIGRCHGEGEPALRMLQAEGFRHDRVVDIFDAGPLVSCARDTIRTVRDSRACRLRIGDVSAAPRALIATGAGADFICLSAASAAHEDEAIVSEATARALGVGAGARILTWIADAA